MKKLFALSNKLFVGLLVCATASFCQAAESPATKLEITHLFAVLESTGCQFNRNGSWYNAKEASAHLQTKYKYLQDKDLVSSAEIFIERAATQSSLSSKAYQIKCADNLAQASAPWFQAALMKYRGIAKNR